MIRYRYGQVDADKTIIVIIVIFCFTIIVLSKFQYRPSLIPYAFPTKPSDEPFPCLFCCLCLLLMFARLSSMYNGLALRLIDIHRFGLSGTVYPRRLCPTAPGRTAYSCRIFAWFTRVCNNHNCAFLNAFNNQAGSYYVIADYYLVWDRSQLYPITGMLLLHLTLARSRAITV